MGICSSFRIWGQPWPPDSFHVCRALEDSISDGVSVLTPNTHLVGLFWVKHQGPTAWQNVNSVGRIQVLRKVALRSTEIHNSIESIDDATDPRDFALGTVIGHELGWKGHCKAERTG